MENKGNNNENGGNNNGGNNKNGMTIMIFVLAALLVLFLTSLLNSCAKDATNKEITYSEFIDMVEKDRVESVTFTSNRINIIPKSENKLYRITYYTAELNDESLLPLLKEHGVKFSGTVEDVSSAIMWNLISYILPLVLVWILLYFLIFRKMGSGGMMGVGKSTAKVYVEKSTGITFKDVAGQEEAKESLQEVVDFLHNPKKYTDIGAKLPKGALLVGPPGTGKTLLAKAVAGEARVPFFSLAGSDFVEMFVGVGASRVRDLFKEAQKQAPCIIFIDEIDAIGKSRDTRYGGNDEREQTLNQLLAEMDGFDTSKGLLILAATNRPEVLDKALLRPGRFDRRIIVDKPDLKGRVETLKVHAKNVLLDDSVDLDAIALATSGAVGSDLANMINEAAINAVKQGRKYVNQSDLFESVEVVIAGKEKKDRIMGPKEKKMVAYHEVGHALVTALQKDTEPVQKITIVPRTMGALGYTMQVPEEEKFLMTKQELIAHLVTYMGGRAAEEIVFDSVTTGASNDIEQATKMARAMVTQYGMSEKFGLMGLVTIENQYLDGRASLNCGEDTAAQIDQEVMRILKESYDEAVRLLQENRSILDEIAQYLYEHETITGKEFMKIFRELKGISETGENSKAASAWKEETKITISKEEALETEVLKTEKEKAKTSVEKNEEESKTSAKGNEGEIETSAEENKGEIETSAKENKGEERAFAKENEEEIETFAKENEEEIETFAKENGEGKTSKEETNKEGKVLKEETKEENLETSGQEANEEGKASKEETNKENLETSGQEANEEGKASKEETNKENLETSVQETEEEIQTFSGETKQVPFETKRNTQADFEFSKGRKGAAYKSGQEENTQADSEFKKETDRESKRKVTSIFRADGRKNLDSARETDKISTGFIYEKLPETEETDEDFEVNDLEVDNLEEKFLLKMSVMEEKMRRLEEDVLGTDTIKREEPWERKNRYSDEIDIEINTLEGEEIPQELNNSQEKVIFLDVNSSEEKKPIEEENIVSNNIKSGIENLESYRNKEKISKGSKGFEELNKDVEGKSKEFKEPKKDIEGKSKRFEEPNKNVEGKSKRFEEPNKNVEGKSERFEEPNKNVEGKSKKFEEPNRNVEGKSKKFEEPNKNIEGKSERFEEPNKNVEGKSKKFEEPNKNVEGKSKRFEEPNKNVEGKSKKFEEPNKNVEGKSKKLEEPNKNVEGKSKEFKESKKNAKTEHKDFEKPKSNAEVSNLSKELKVTSDVSREKEFFPAKKGNVKRAKAGLSKKNAEKEVKSISDEQAIQTKKEILPEDIQAKEEILPEVVQTKEEILPKDDAQAKKEILPEDTQAKKEILPEDAQAKKVLSEEMPAENTEQSIDGEDYLDKLLKGMK